MSKKGNSFAMTEFLSSRRCCFFHAGLLVHDSVTDKGGH